MNSTPPQCINCGGTTRLKFQPRDYNRGLKDEAFDYFQCENCKLIFLSPVPADLGSYYPKSYYDIPASVDQLKAGLPWIRYKMEIISQFKTGGKFLEIGPACGDLSFQAKLAGFEVDAIEMDARCCEFLNAKVGINAICTADTNAALACLGTYDVIALWHVIEHLVDAWKTVELAARHLKPGGILVIAAPNPEAFQFSVMGKYWPHVDAPRHVMLIPLKLLSQKAGEFGLATLWHTTDDEGGRGWNQFGWERFLSNFVRSEKAKSRMQKWGRSLSKRLKSFDRKAGQGSAYTVVFQAPNPS